MLGIIIRTIWFLLQAVIALHIVFPLFSYLLNALKKKQPILPNHKSTQNDYAVIVTAYQNTGNLDLLINSLLLMEHQNFIIYVVADNCPHYEDQFNDDRVVIIKPAITLGNQLHSHFLAIKHFKRPHQYLTIIDSDNIVHPNYLAALDPFFNAGYEAVQGVRTAKNLNTNFACIDAANELYYLFYDRIILYNIGSSSMLSGSGMAFTVSLYKDCLENISNAGAGFDKILQYQILKRNYRIAFAKEAIVYDEKTAYGDQLVKQRARWNNTWFRYFKYGFKLMKIGLLKQKLNPFLFGFILTRPPLFILISVGGLLFLINLFLSIKLAMIWFLVIGIFIVGFFIALGKSNADKKIYKALLMIPKFMFLQFLSLGKAKKANELSVATEHDYNKKPDVF